MGVIIRPFSNAESKYFKMYFLSFSLLVSIIRVSNSLHCLPCCEDNNPVQVAAVEEDVPLAVSVLGGAEPPSYEECHVCPKLEHQECGGPCGVDGPCADYLQCVKEYPEDQHSRGTCQRQHTTVAKCCDMKRKIYTGQVYVVDKESNSYCTEGCAYREKGMAHSPVYCLGNKWDSHRYECLRH